MRAILLRGGPTAVCPDLIRWFSHYRLLGIHESASIEDIKRAFRERAKVVHPDARPDASADRTQWVEVLTAYQVLSDPRSRQLYDLSLSETSAGVLRRAAAAGVRHGAHEDVDIDLSWDLGASWAERGANNGQGGALDRLRRDLVSDWHAALRHAYLGPRIDALGRGELPDCFEGDERATPDTDEVLQLVSGRQLLGAVRLRRSAALTADERRAWLGQGDAEAPRDPALLAAFDAAAEPQLPVAAAGEGASSGAPLAPNESQPNESESDSSLQPPVSPNKESPDPPVILDLILGEEVVATAVSCPTLPYSTEPLPEPTAAENEPLSPDAITTLFFRGPRLVAQLLEDGTALAARRAASASRLLAPGGAHTHTLVRNVTPLVRHLMFVAETGPARRLGRTVVARAHRAWLPPSSLWLFKPRSYAHDIGGWVVSWTGEAARGHRAALDPGVITLCAALDTLSHEAAAQQPQGLFSRLRHGDETQRGGVLAWARAALRFHRGQGSGN